MPEPVTVVSRALRLSAIAFMTALTVLVFPPLALADEQDMAALLSILEAEVKDASLGVNFYVNELLPRAGRIWWAQFSYGL